MLDEVCTCSVKHYNDPTPCDARLPMLTKNQNFKDYTVHALSATLPEINATFSTNLFSVMNICATFSPLLIRSRGTIVQIGSISGVIPYVFGSVYNAFKAALHSYSDSLCVELAPFGVDVITVVTGVVKSNIARTKRTLPEDSPLKRTINDGKSTVKSQAWTPRHTLGKWLAKFWLAMAGSGRGGLYGQEKALRW